MSAQESRPNWQDAYAVIEPQINADAVHVWPFDPAFPLDLRFLIFEERRDIRLNRHDYLELFYVDSGQLTLHVHGRNLAMGAGSLTVIGSTQYHNITVNQQGPSQRRIARGVVLYFLPTLFGRSQLVGDDAHYLTPFQLLDAGAPHVLDAETAIPKRVLALFRKIAQQLPPTTALNRLEAKTHLKLILLELAKHYSSAMPRVDEHDRRRRDIQRLAPVFDYVDAHYREPIAVARAAKTVHMSPSHFRRFFKQVTGQPFLAYLNDFRIAKAQQLLLSTSKSLAEIALDVGFCDQSYFGLVFKRTVRMTPKQYQHQFAPE